MNTSTPPPATSTPPPVQRPIWRDGMFWLIVGIVSMVLGGNAIMITIAVRSQPNLVRSDYYEASKYQDEELALLRASDHLGWQLTVDAEARTDDMLALRIVDRDGHAVGGLAGSVSAYRPSDAALDQPLEWQEDTTTPGLYRARFARPAAGLWRITLDVHRGASRLVHHLSVVMPAAVQGRP